MGKMIANIDSIDFSYQKPTITPGHFEGFVAFTKYPMGCISLHKSYFAIIIHPQSLFINFNEVRMTTHPHSLFGYGKKNQLQAFSLS